MAGPRNLQLSHLHILLRILNTTDSDRINLNVTIYCQSHLVTLLHLLLSPSSDRVRHCLSPLQIAQREPPQIVLKCVAYSLGIQHNYSILSTTYASNDGPLLPDYSTSNSVVTASAGPHYEVSGSSNDSEHDEHTALHWSLMILDFWKQDLSPKIFPEPDLWPPEVLWELRRLLERIIGKHAKRSCLKATNLKLDSIA